MVLATAGLVAVLVLTSLLWNIVVTLDKIRQAPHEGLQWNAYLLDREYHELLIATLTWEPGDPAATADIVRRAHSLGDTVIFLQDRLEQSPALGAALTSTESILRFTAMVNNLLQPGEPVDGGKITRLRTMLRETEPTVDEFSFATLDESNLITARWRADLERTMALSALVAGALLAALATALVVLARQRARLRQDKEQLRISALSLTETQRIARLGTFWWDYVVDRVRWSDELAAIYGIAIDGAMTGSEFGALLHPADRERVEGAERAAAAQSASTGQPVAREVTYRVRRPDGSIAHVQATAEVVADASGQRISMTSTVRDITVEAQQRSTLVASERGLAEAQRIAHLGSFSVNLPTGQADWSDEMYRITGLPSDPFGKPGPRLEEVVHPDDLGRLQADMQRALALPLPGGSAQVPLQHRLIWRDGSVRYVKGMAEYVFDAAGVPLTLTGTLQDVTDDVEQEQALQAAKQEAEKANAAKSEFLAVMSHELRTPMNGVLGMLSALLETPLDADQQKLVTIARASADSLLLLLNDILDLSKIEAGKLELETTTFELLPLVRSVVHLYAQPARLKNISLESQIAADVPAWLAGDAGRVRQILLNFASNAVKFTTRGGITISVSALAPPMDGQVRLRFEIADTGIGIPIEKQGEVFAKFNQLDRSYARRFGGTGLGLAISRQLAEIMGGAIGFSSEAERGSKFWIELPLAIAEPEAVADGRRETEIAPMKILVAEDNTTNQLVARRLLEKLGHTVDVVSDGVEAVEAVMSHSYDAILMDLSMPKMDGIAATMRIRQIGGPSGAVPIIALTANAMDEDRQACLDAGMTGFVTKPIVLAKLVTALAACAAGLPDERADVEAEIVQPAAADDFEVSLAHLESEVGREIMPELLAAYDADVRRALARLGEASRAEDRLELGRAAHSLRSVAMTLGANELSQLAQATEASGGSEQPIAFSDVSRKLSEIAEPVLDRVSQAISKYT
ncbi:hybrid sensor histidine kinase/response regulator [Devosia sp.]|uniref:hybrid sensor histidine kinase/response regulator n=1 Tax=Devosia sp. TaxID=1871048 RepID=UPI002618F280|nr:hybrid sensor histidine kinase/response regulator [Devosia sp.]